MKILFITHYDNMYGANKALLSLMLSLKQRGQEVMLVIPAEGEMTKCLEEEGIPYILSSITAWEAPLRTIITFWLKKIKRKKRIKEEVQKLYLQTKDLGIDIIHSNTSVIGTGAMLAEKLHCKHIWHVREYGREHFGNRSFFAKDYVRKFYEQADAVICISKALEKRTKLLYKNANIRMIYDGVTIGEEIEPVALSQKDGIVRFVYLGYLFPMKHQLDVMQACQILQQEGITNYEVLLAGGGNQQYTDKLKNFQKKNSLEMVHLVGYVKKPYELLSQCDVGMIASEYEGFGLVTIEYMLHALPVLGRNSGATPELLQTGKNGYLYDTPAELATYMKQLIVSREERIKMGSIGRKIALQQFSEEHNVEQMIQLYEELKG